MNVRCWLDDCLHCEKGKCQLSEITVDIDGCEEYLIYSESADYQEEYWKIVKTENKLGRAAARGKHIQINGVDFFTESDDRVPEEQIFLTNARTGYLAGSVSFVKENFKEVLEVARNLPDVTQYPICEFDEAKQQYVIREEKLNEQLREYREKEQRAREYIELLERYINDTSNL